MFDSGVLDVAIGLMLVFILVSTVCAAIREAIESLLKTRAAYLEYAIRELLNDRKGSGLAQSFFQHPLIHGLFQSDYASRSTKPTVFARGGTLPSYIPARSFATALIDLVARGADVRATAGGGRLTIALLRERVRELPDPFLQRALTAAIDSAGDDLERLRKNIETWFDTSMDRVSGWYKRSTQRIIFGIALVVVFALNLNSITIADTLYRDQATRSAATALAAQVDRGQRDPELALQALDRLRLPIGWRETAWDEWKENMAPLTFGAFLLHFVKPLLGLLLTAFAATLGAPFWFDVLNKVMVIRATVKPHEKSQEEGSEDRPLSEPARANTPPAAGGGGDGLTTPPGLTEAPANANAAVHPHDGDGCSEDEGDPTPDEALPAAVGGVKS